VQEIYTGTGIPEVEHSRTDEARQDAAQVLRFEGVNTFYGKSHILHDADAGCARGARSWHCSARNGAGKFDAPENSSRAGCRWASGTIEYDGRNIAGLPAPDISRMGIGYVPQGRGLFAGMTVRGKSLASAAWRARPTAATAWCGARSGSSNIFPRLKRAHGRCGGLPVRRRAADGGGGRARHVGQT